MFRASPRFRVHTHAEAAVALTPAELADLLAGRVTPAVKAGLLKGFGATKLLVVTIRPVDAAEGIYHYGTEGQLLDAASDSPPERFSTMGFSRDRRDRLAWIVLANVALLALALAAYALIVRTHRALAVDTSWLTLLLAPLAGFAVGRILPCVIAPLLGSMRLGPGTPLAAAFWFPLVAGLGLWASRWRSTGWRRPSWPSCGRFSVWTPAAARCSPRSGRASPPTLPDRCCCTWKGIC